MFDLPMQPMMIVAQAEAGAPSGQQLYAEVANAADLDLGYEVAFPFLTTVGDSSGPGPARPW